MPIEFLSRQPFQATEFNLPIAPDLVAEMNRWRLAQSPTLDPDQAIVALIRLGLQSTDPAFAIAATSETVLVDALAQELRSTFERKSAAKRASTEV